MSNEDWVKTSGKKAYSNKKAMQNFIPLLSQLIPPPARPECSSSLLSKEECVEGCELN